MPTRDEDHVTGGGADHGQAALREARNDREQLLERLFDRISELRRRARAELAAQFDLEAHECIEPHSPLLRKSAGPTRSGLTVRELVQDLLPL
ncbi:hypothetical protein LVJ94_35390 [Pendulispora rubella]|uniref:Transcriptional regulator n=1 Tax=Pendulispora rubella TaxID=2741070 RepID=A0ABZ2KWN8_9BACT